MEKLAFGNVAEHIAVPRRRAEKTYFAKNER